MKIYRILLFVLLFINIFTLQVYGEISLGIDVKPNITKPTSNDSLLNLILKDYEQDMKLKNIKVNIQNYSDELSNSSNNTIPSNLSKDIVKNSFNKTKKNNLITDIKGKVPSSLESKVLEKLVKSVVDVKSKQYRLIIESKYSVDEVKSALLALDRLNVNFLYTNKNGSNYYEIIIPNNSIIGTQLIDYVKLGQLPQDLFFGITVVKPFYVKLNYLSGENVTNMWGIRSIGADNYQVGLSNRPKIKVGVIDTGIDYTHGDLIGNMNVNIGEIPGNGIDDDGNGYIDDVHGYDFVSNSPNANDDHGHGTHVAGVIGGKVNGGGVFGVNSNSSLVALRVLDSSGYGSSYGVIDAINYAANNNIKIINMSLGGDGNPSTDIICTAITNAKTKGVISIVAAGNENASVSGKVPAGCTDVITVGAVDSNLNKASFSNYGSKVEIAAPGVNIYSTYYLNRYASMNGTSMATPFVAGLASAVLAYNSGYNTDTMRTLLVNNSNVLNITPNVGKYIDMGKVMSSIGVNPDSGVANKLPTLTLSSTKLSKNYFRVNSNANDQDGTIVKYEYLVDGVIIGSGANLNSFTFTINKNTVLLVRVTDNDGGVMEKSLSFVAEVNILPTLTITSTRLSKNYYRIVSTAKDTDGTIAKYEYSINGEYYTGGASLSSVNLTLTKDSVISIKVTDNLGGAVEKTLNLKLEPNSLPVISIINNKLSKNNYMLNITATDSDGTVVNYEYTIDGIVVGSGTYLKSYLLNVSQDLTFGVKVTDNQGGVSEKSQIFKFESNILPTLSIVSSKISKNYYKITSTAKDTDGTIINYEYLINDTIVASGAKLTTTNIIITEPSSLIVRVTDNLGGVAQKTANLVFENNNPPSLTLASKKILKNYYSVTSTATDSDGTIVNYEYLINGVVVASGAKANVYSLIIQENTELVVKVKDNLGGVSEKSLSLIFEENILPKISLSSTKILKGNYTITATASDIDGKIAKYEYYVDDILVSSGAQLTKYNVLFKKDVVVKVVVTDNLGGSSQASLNLVFEENVLPTLNLTGTRAVGNRFNIVASATDPDGGIVKYEYILDNKIVASGATLTKYSLNLDKDEELLVRVTDKLGGITEKNLELDFDESLNSLPVVTFTPKRIGINKHTITVSATDLDGTIASYDLYLDGVFHSSGTKLYNAVLTKDLEVLFKVTDNVGGITEKSVLLKFEPNIAPTLTVVSKKLTNNYYTITATAKDTDGTILNYEYFIDGILVGSGAKMATYNLRLMKDVNLLVKVTDNGGLTTEKSLDFKFDPNILPNLTLISKKLSKNYYTITSTASDIDGSISNYEYLINDSVISSGAKLNTYTLVIQENTQLTVRVTDNLGGITEKQVSLVYELNSLPTLTLVSKKLNKNYYTIITTAKDIDGTITNYEYYIDDLLINSGAKLTTININIKKDSTLKVVVTDNLGGVSQETMSYKFETNLLPTLTITPKKLYANTYSVTSTATDSDGYITNYEYYQDGVLINSGSKLTSISLVIKKDIQLIVKVYDNVGGETQKNLNLIHEFNNLPSLSLKFSKPLKNHYTVTSTASDLGGYITNYEYLIDDVVVASGAKLSSYFILIKSDTNLLVRVTDNLGGVTEKSINLVYEENLLPTLILTGSVVVGNRYNVLAKATDPDGGITKYEFIINEKVVLAGASSTSYTLNITEDTLVTVKVTDKLGGIVQQSVLLKFDLAKNSLPTVNVASKLVATNKYTYTVTASDLDGSVVKYEIYQDDVLIPNVTKLYTAVITKDTTFKFRAIDNLGGFTDKIIPVIFTKPNVVPVVDLSKEITSGGIPYVKINITDTDGIINTVNIYVNGYLFKTESPKNSVYNYNISYKNPNKYIFKVVVTDNKGGTSTKELQIN